jgi:streptogramin lyase
MLLIGSVAGSPPAEAGTTITLGSGFNAPEGVAVDANGHVFVADTYNNAVKELLPPGYTTANPIGSTSNLPNSIAVDTSGDVWFIDIQNGVRKILAPDYTTVTQSGIGTNQAKGVAVDASGNVFVADTGNHRVIEALAAGGYTTVNELGSGFSSPTGVAVDANGNVFVVDWLKSMVYEILKAGGYTTVVPIADLVNCNGIALDTSSNIYVACPFGVAKLLASNGYATVDYIGSGLNHPYGVAVDTNGNVFVADTYNYEVKEITSALAPTITKDFAAATIPLNGTTSLTFTLTNPNVNAALTVVAFTDNLPAGLVVATPNGLNNTCGGTATAVAGASSTSLSVNLAAGASCTMTVDVNGTTAGIKNNSVQVTSYNGGTGNTANATLTVATSAPTITQTFGSAVIPVNATTPLTFTLIAPNSGSSQTGVAFTDNLPGGLVVASPNGLANTCGGTATAAAGGSSASLSGATLADGATCAVSVIVRGTTRGVKNNSVQVTSTNGGAGNTANATLTVSLLACAHPDTILCKGFEASTTVPILTGIIQFYSVVLDASGNAFVTDSNDNVKEILAPDYTTVKTLGSGFNSPNGVAVDASGNVFVADSGNNAVKVILPPAYTTVNTIGSGFSYPFSVALDASGNVFVADTSHDAVKEIVKAGGYTTVNTIGGGFWHPEGVTVDALGNVYVADHYNDAVKVILAPDYTTVNTLGSGFNKPVGVAVDASGNVFVADRFNDAVKEILATGGYTTVFPIGTGFSAPFGVAVDASGDVFVADTYNYAIKVIVR